MATLAMSCSSIASTRGANARSSTVPHDRTRFFSRGQQPREAGQRRILILRPMRAQSGEVKVRGTSYHGAGFIRNPGGRQVCRRILRERDIAGMPGLTRGTAPRGIHTAKQHEEGSGRRLGGAGLARETGRKIPTTRCGWGVPISRLFMRDDGGDFPDAKEPNTAFHTLDKSAF